LAKNYGDYRNRAQYDKFREGECHLGRVARDKIRDIRDCYTQCRYDECRGAQLQLALIFMSVQKQDSTGSLVECSTNSAIASVQDIEIGLEHAPFVVLVFFPHLNMQKSC
jgi:hypothetical protein